MIKKSTVALMALIVLMVIVSGCTTNNNNTTQNNTQNLSNQGNNNSNNSNTTNTTNSTKVMSKEEAKKIAQQYVDEPGVTAGTPVLNTVNGRQIYVVPLYDNGQAVGEIELDAVTGENLGGAGGAP
ncbi:MAG: Peptidase propeptide domain-containing protein [Methanobacterium sp. Maddingley MBC34]|nr:MAG: Peptidase propeptide domain-containing protein [Methanobacterium sp. Maddingley MBC34]